MSINGHFGHLKMGFTASSNFIGFKAMREILWVIQQLQTNRLIGHPWQQSVWQLPGQWLLLKGLMIDPGSAKSTQEWSFWCQSPVLFAIDSFKCVLVSPHWSLCNFDACIQLLPGRIEKRCVGKHVVGRFGKCRGLKRWARPSQEILDFGANLIHQLFAGRRAHGRRRKARLFACHEPWTSCCSRMSKIIACF